MEVTSCALAAPSRANSRFPRRIADHGHPCGDSFPSAPLRPTMLRAHSSLHHPPTRAGTVARAPRLTCCRRQMILRCGSCWTVAASAFTSTSAAWLRAARSPRQGEVLRFAHHPTWATVLKEAGGGRSFAVLAACGLPMASRHRQWRRRMVDIAPNSACPWCHADDTNLHMLSCMPDGRGFVLQQQSTLFHSLSPPRTPALAKACSGSWTSACLCSVAQCLPSSKWRCRCARR